jgi:hypothetical protein
MTDTPEQVRLRFSSMLALEGIKPEQVQLVRHHDARATSLTTPYALWVNDDPGFNLYQSIQHRRVFREAEGSLLAVFVVTPPPTSQTLFVGLWGVHGIGTTEPGTIDPVRGHEVQPMHLYDLRPDPRLAWYAGKVVVDWGAGYRSWVQRAHKQDKVVLEVRPKFQEPDFPGWDGFAATLSEIAKLPAGWQQVLRANQGVYLLSNVGTHEQYVGSATGEGGFLARWEQHALKGGDAVKFKAAPGEYRVVVLEVCGTNMTQHDVQVAEQRWIRKLQSVEMGLNGNPGGYEASAAAAPAVLPPLILS